MPEKVTVYFDYLCPFAWRAAEMAEVIADELGLMFHWHHFSLYQSNYRGSNNWQLWNEKIVPNDETGTKGLLPFLASLAARRQRPEHFHQFRLEVMRKRHQHNQLYSLEMLTEVAENVGLCVSDFHKDLKNPECRTLLAREHHQAAALNVFGTPTFHFATGHLAYFRMAQLPASQEEMIRLFTDYRRLLESYPYLETVKRPRPKKN